MAFADMSRDDQEHKMEFHGDSSCNSLKSEMGLYSRTNRRLMACLMFQGVRRGETVSVPCRLLNKKLPSATTGELTDPKPVTPAEEGREVGERHFASE